MFAFYVLLLSSLSLSASQAQRHAESKEEFLKNLQQDLRSFDANKKPTDNFQTVVKTAAADPTIAQHFAQILQLWALNRPTSEEEHLSRLRLSALGQLAIRASTQEERTGYLEQVRQNSAFQQLDRELQEGYIRALCY